MTRAEHDGTARVSVTAILAKVCAWALERHPLVNASWHEDGIEMHEQANIGVAVALDDGLIVPVVQDVAPKGLAEIASNSRVDGAGAFRPIATAGCAGRHIYDQQSGHVRHRPVHGDHQRATERHSGSWAHEEGSDCG